MQTLSKWVMVLATPLLFASACTQETQNQIGRSIQNWTGTNGILEMSTAMGTSDGSARSYRYGYGVIDLNLNGKVDPGERRVYFEISDYSTSYIFYEAP